MKAMMKKIILALLTAGLVGTLHVDVALSRDTDIYFTNPNATQADIRPNVMMIIDTSGSMVSNTVSDGKGGQITRLQAMKNAFNTILDDPSTKGINMGLMRFSGGRGGPVLFPVVDLDALATDKEGNYPITVETGLAANSDDAEENTSGAITLGDTTLNLIDNGSNVVGLRFANVAIPTGAKITGAYIVFDANGSDSTAVSMTISAQKSTSSATFTTTTNDVTSRTDVTNGLGTSVTWTPGNWNNGEKQGTGDLSTIVQALVNPTNSWCNGDSMVFTFKGNGATANLRRASAAETGASTAPVLVIQYDPTQVASTGCTNASVQVRVSSGNDDAEEYTSTTSVSTSGTVVLNENVLEIVDTSVTKFISGKNTTKTVNQNVGLRFVNVNVPKDATITSAYIDFTVNSADNTAASLIITGQRATNAGSFTSAATNVSTRINATNKTVASVGWPTVPNTSVSMFTTSILTTPDLTPIVQELVKLSTPDWSPSSNSMIFVLGGTGVRHIKSYDQQQTTAPLLRITYKQPTVQTADAASALTVRERLKQIVNGMSAAGYTPIVDALYEAGLYYRGKDVLYGLKRGDQSGSDSQYTRVSHFATYTGSTGLYRAGNCTDANLNDTSCVTEEILGAPTYKSPFNKGCQNSYIVLLTDGAPTANNSKSLVESYTGTTCKTSVAGTSGACSAELVSYYANNNISSYSDPHYIYTHTVGFGTDVSNTTDVKYLKDEVATSGMGTYHAAQDAAELVSAFQDIMSKVNSNPTAFVSPSLSVNAFNKLYNRDEVYFSLFAPHREVRWPGNVKKFMLCNDATNVKCTFGDVLDAKNKPAIGSDAKIYGGASGATSYWTSGADIPDGPTVDKGGSGQQIPDYAVGNRNVYTYTDSVDVPAPPVDLTLADHAVKQAAVSATLDNPKLTKTMLGNSAMTDQRYYDIVNWMRGRDTNDQYPLDSDGVPKGNSINTDNRWKFGDALHSRPLTVTYGGTTDKPVIKIFVGTNDGALRMINADNSSGKEEWVVYIPDFLSQQGAIMDDAIGTHITGLDGTATAYIIDNNKNGIIEPGSPNNDKVYLYIGERRGGRNIYAFDVTPGSALTDPTAIGEIKPKFLWRIKGGSGGFGALGQTWSRPTLTKIRVKGASPGTSTLKDVLIFAGGYDPRLDTPGTNKVYPTGADTMGNAIYIVDPLNGSLIWWAGNSSSTANYKLAGLDYAIPSDVALLDTNNDGATDRLYVGDTRGQLWRIDLGDQIDSPGTTATGGSSGYLFANIGISATLSSNRKFFYPPDVASAHDTAYSSSPDYDIVAIESGDREDPLDKLTAVITSQDPVHNRLYAFRDYNYKTGAPTTATTTITESKLFDATNETLRTATGSALTTEIDKISSDNGWFIKLKDRAANKYIGEKGLAKPVIFQSKIFFTTYVPAASSSSSAPGTCRTLSEGTGYLYVLDYLTGNGVVDLNKDKTIDRSVPVGGGIPSETVVIIREGGVTTLVGTSGGAARPDVGLTMPRYNTYWYQE